MGSQGEPGKDGADGLPGAEGEKVISQIQTGYCKLFLNNVIFNTP